MAVCASTLLLPDGDGLPYFDDNDTDSDPLSVVVRTSHATLPPASGAPDLSRSAAPVVAPIEVSLPDAVPSRLLPSRSPPRT